MLNDWPKLDDEVIKDESRVEIPVENLKLLLSLTQDSMKSQVEGARQIFSRIVALLTFSTTLTTAMAGAIVWSFQQPTNSEANDIWFALLVPGCCWLLAAVCALIGMRGAKLSAPGVRVRDGYRIEVVGIEERRMCLWAIRSIAENVEAGEAPIRRLLDSLDLTILFIVVGATTLLLGVPLLHFLLV